MKKLLLYLTITMLFQQTIPAQDYKLPLWPAGKIPNYQKTDEKEKWDSGKVITVSLVQTPEIAVYLPTQQTATGQAVIICPGGGYRFLAYNLEGTDVAYWLVQRVLRPLY